MYTLARRKLVKDHWFSSDFTCFIVDTIRGHGVTQRPANILFRDPRVSWVDVYLVVTKIGNLRPSLTFLWAFT